jgi:hypothetical protein
MCGLWAGFLPLLLCGALYSARAGAIVVPNNSFESPATPYVSINIDSWQKTAKPADYQESGGFLWTQLTGIFKNTPTNSSDHIDNCDGNQALWIFAVPQAGLFQDYDSTDWHNQPPNHQFDATYRVGRTYNLTVGVIGSGGGMSIGATLELSLYYRDAASNQVPVAVTTLTNSPDVFSNGTHLVDCHVNLPAVRETDPWAGQHIGIQLLSTVSTNLEGGYWDLDNVRLYEGPSILTSPGFAGGKFSFTIVGQPGAAFEILASSNAALSSSVWQSAGFVTNTTGTAVFTDTAPVAAPKFYRARQLP